MGWLRNRRRRKAAEALADVRMAESGFDLDEAILASDARMAGFLEVMARDSQAADLPRPRDAGE